SGSGKSTILDLMLGLHTPGKGNVYYRGVDMREISPELLHREIAVISQRPEIFDATIRENVVLGGAGDVAERDLHEAARKAHIYDFVMGLPDGFDTNIGENGAQLSGGQLQRIVLARAILMAPKIILLDEPTNALDKNSETLIRSAVRHHLARDCTYVEVTHREYLYNEFDAIIHIDGGMIVDRPDYERRF